MGAKVNWRIWLLVITIVASIAGAFCGYFVGAIKGIENPDWLLPLLWWTFLLAAIPWIIYFAVIFIMAGLRCRCGRAGTANPTK